MSCKICKGNRVMLVNAKCSDCCQVNLDGKDKVGYVPSEFGIGGGDYIEFDLCLDCGRIQGSFPVEQAAIEEVFGEKE